MHTRSGRLPLVLRITPTEVGERALIWCRAGICAEDFEAHSGEIAAACYARQARIECLQTAGAARHPRHRAPRHPRRAQRHLVRPGPGRIARTVLAPAPPEPRMRTADPSPEVHLPCEGKRWHASKRRIHVLGPPDALAPRRHHPADYPGDWDTARKLAGLDWDPVTADIYAIDGITADGSPGLRAGSRAGRPSPGPTPEPSCRSTKTPTPSSTTARWARSSKPFSPSPTSSGKPPVSWTAAARSGASPCWTSPSTLTGDDSLTLPYLAITNRHDGTAACALRATAVRIVCANTFRAAELEGERTGATFSFIHKSSWRNRIEEARQAVTGARTEIRRYTELARELLGVPSRPGSGSCSSPSSSPCRHRA